MEQLVFVSSELDTVREESAALGDWCNKMLLPLLQSNNTGGLVDGRKSALLALLFRAVQYKLPAQSFSDACQLHKLPSQLADIYSQYGAQLRSLIECVGWQPCELLDIQWTLLRPAKLQGSSGDWCECYELNVIVQDMCCVAPRHIQLYTNLSGLNDLLLKMKQAHRAMLSMTDN